MTKKIEGVYLVTDNSLCLGRSLVDIVRASIAGGVKAIQIREKNITSRDFVELGRAISNITKPACIPLIINDRADIAQIIKADGLHIGQSDIAYQDAREIMGADAIIGLSIENIEQALVSKTYHDLDYIGASPVFGTPTKTDTAPALGLEGLAELRRIVDIPIVAIGGITTQNCRDVIQHGADSIAVVSAICSSADPEHATRELADFFI